MDKIGERTSDFCAAWLGLFSGENWWSEDGGQIEELEARRAKLEAKLDAIKRQKRAIEQATAARRGQAERKADAHRKIVLGGALLALLRGNPQLLDYLRRELPKVTAERDLPILSAVLNGLGAPEASWPPARP